MKKNAEGWLLRNRGVTPEDKRVRPKTCLVHENLIGRCIIDLTA